MSRTARMLLGAATVAAAAHVAGAAPAAANHPQWTQEQYAGAETWNAVSARFVLSDGPNRPATGTERVQFRTSDGGATAGEDYVAVDQIYVFQPGETGYTLSVRILDDDVEEGAESFFVSFRMLPGDGSDPPPDAGWQRARVLLHDDEAPPTSSDGGSPHAASEGAAGPAAAEGPGPGVVAAPPGDDGGQRRAAPSPSTTSLVAAAAGVAPERPEPGPGFELAATPVRAPGGDGDPPSDAAPRAAAAAAVALAGVATWRWWRSRWPSAS